MVIVSCYNLYKFLFLLIIVNTHIFCGSLNIRFKGLSFSNVSIDNLNIGLYFGSSGYRSKTRIKANARREDVDFIKKGFNKKSSDKFILIKSNVIDYKSRNQLIKHHYIVFEDGKKLFSGKLPRYAKRSKSLRYIFVLNPKKDYTVKAGSNYEIYLFCNEDILDTINSTDQIKDLNELLIGLSLENQCPNNSPSVNNNSSF